MVIPTRVSALSDKVRPRRVQMRSRVRRILSKFRFEVGPNLSETTEPFIYALAESIAVARQQALDADGNNYLGKRVTRYEV